MFGITGQMENPLRAALRVLEVGWRTGLANQLLTTRAPMLLRQLALDGFNVRAIHALHAIARPDALAIVDDRVEVTWARANVEIGQIAASLAARFGVRRGTPVAIMLENRVEYLLAWFALFRLGAMGVHASWRMTHEELEFQLENSGAKVLFVSAASLETAQRLVGRRPDLGLRLIVVGDEEWGTSEWIQYRELLRGHGSARVARGAVARRGRAEPGARNVVYTSGTTGRPKGAVRDFKRLGLIELTRILERLPLQAGERHLIVSPLYHSAGQAFSLVESCLGSTLYLRSHFEAEDALQALSRYSIDSVFLVPTMLQQVLELPDGQFRQWPTRELRAVVCGAAPFPQPLREKAIERFGAERVFDFYGATELGWVTVINGVEMLRKPGSVGRPLAGQQIHIEDERGRVLPPREKGRIWVRNRQLSDGYLREGGGANDPSRRGPWVTVDDLGYVDGEGYLYLAGRAREMVISGGVNLYPAEIEEALLRHPDIAEVAVFGVPDPHWGERLVAAAVMRRPVRPAALVAWARERLSSYKIPREWRFYASLPRNPTGKVLKARLAEEYAPVEQSWPPEGGEAPAPA